MASPYSRGERGSSKLRVLRAPVRLQQHRFKGFIRDDFSNGEIWGRSCTVIFLFFSVGRPVKFTSNVT